jgi:magnesium transporter
MGGKKMVKMVRKSHKAGLPPGTLIHVGELKSSISIVTVCGYDQDLYWEKKTDDVEECRALLEERAPVRWVNIDGLAGINLLQEIGGYFNLHQLTLEDILNTDQRPRQEPYNNYTYVVLKALNYNEEEKKVESEQVSLIIGSDYVFSISERETDIFESLRKRIAAGKGNIRKQGADYLAYSLLDIIVDNYFSVLEKVGERLEALEEMLLTSPDEKTLQAVHFYKREMLGMRQAIWPLREALIGLEQSDSVFVHTDTALHLRDVYFHAVQIIDTIEIYREMLSVMLEIYLSSVNNRLNEVMKILTIFAAIFIPLTLISGIYGMNFIYMPELNWRYGYQFALGLMVVVAAIMLHYFKRKNWL